MELANNGQNTAGVQGVDYAYTLQGWLKGINGEQIPLDGTTQTDMSGDGVSGSMFSGFGQDVLGYSLGYYKGDYTPIQPASAIAYPISFTPNGNNSGTGANLYNGNISYSTNALTSFAPTGSSRSGFTGYTYRYDQLNRLTAMDHHLIGSTDGSATWNSTSYFSNNYGEKATYDGNGNILTYQRQGPSVGTLMDNLTYNYTRDGSGNLLTNRLGYINDAVASNVSMQDLDNQSAGNYNYDNNGNLIGDVSQNLGMIYWNSYGKMAQIYQGAPPSQGITYGQGPGLFYGYDPSENRIAKTYTASDGSGTTTYYVRDAQENVLAVYQYKTNASGAITEGDWVEQHLYGMKRLGMLQPRVTIPTGQALANDQYNSNMDSLIERQGNRLYELNNHLGNVMAAVTDVLIPSGQSGNSGTGPLATIEGAQDYYPFGMQMPGRTYIATWAGSLNYRYGFNGKENDNEIEGVGNSIDYGMRVYDPRSGRFLSLDPIAAQYPWNSPYAFAENDVIRGIDLEGLEKYLLTTSASTDQNGQPVLSRHLTINPGPTRDNGHLIGVYDKNNQNEVMVDDANKLSDFDKGVYDYAITSFDEGKYTGVYQRLPGNANVNLKEDKPTVVQGVKYGTMTVVEDNARTVYPSTSLDVKFKMSNDYRDHGDQYINQADAEKSISEFSNFLMSKGIKSINVEIKTHYHDPGENDREFDNAGNLLQARATTVRKSFAKYGVKLNNVSFAYGQTPGVDASATTAINVVIGWNVTQIPVMQKLLNGKPVGNIIPTGPGKTIKMPIAPGEVRPRPGTVWDKPKN